MKKYLQTIAARVASGLHQAGQLAIRLRADALIACGAGAIAYGAWLIYVPAGFVVGGLMSLTAGVLAARKGA